MALSSSIPYFAHPLLTIKTGILHFAVSRCKLHYDSGKRSCQVQVVSNKPRKLKHTYVNITRTFLNAVLCVPVLIMIISDALFDKNVKKNAFIKYYCRKKN